MSEAWYGIGVIICNSLFPAIINAKKISKKLYYARIQNLFRLLIIIAYLLSISVYLLSDNIILTFYGEEYINAASVLSIHIFSVIFVYLGVSSGRWIISENKTILNLYRTVSGMIMNILLNYFLIEKYGIVGAAYASLFSYIYAYYIFDIFITDMRKIFILKTKSLFLKGFE